MNKINTNIYNSFNNYYTPSQHSTQNSVSSGNATTDNTFEQILEQQMKSGTTGINPGE